MFNSEPIEVTTLSEEADVAVSSLTEWSEWLAAVITAIINFLKKVGIIKD